MLKTIELACILFVIELRLRLLDKGVHLKLACMLLLMPSLGYGLPGHILRFCGIEIKSDFIQKNENPCEDQMYFFNDKMKYFEDVVDD